VQILLVNKSSEVYSIFPFHKHGYWEIILNLYGSGTAIIDGVKYPFTEGTIFVCLQEYCTAKQQKRALRMHACL
jgi:hypothetical protein